MSYLYGDSTPSSLKVNFLELLRDAVDFFAEIERAGKRLEEGRERVQAWKQSAEVEVARIEAIDRTVTQALAGVNLGAADSPTARCASLVARTVTGLVRGEVETVVARMAEQIARSNAEAVREGEGCLRALEALLRRHDLPETTTAIALRAVDGAPYGARLRLATSFGLVATIDLEVPATHLFGHPLRLDRVVERLEVEAPESSGWLQKKVKLRPQRIERHFLIELSSDTAGVVLKLRGTAAGTDGGFDLRFAAEGPVRLVTIDDKGEPVDEPMVVEGEDRAKLVALRDKLLASAAELTPLRRALVEAKLDGVSFADHATPTELVERVVTAIAPEVQEIARHSLTDGELVLKRLLGDGRREEIFVSKAELARKLEQLPDTRRAIFEPLGLDGGSGHGAPAAPPRRASPPPPPARAPSSEPEIAEISSPSILVEDSGVILIDVDDSGSQQAVPPSAKDR